MLNRLFFSPIQRIREQHDFSRTFKKGRRLYSPLCTAYLNHKTDSPHPRLGVVVSKRSVRRAVYRNQFKRLAREQFRLAQKQLPPLDVVIVANKQAQAASKEALREYLASLFQKLSQ